MSRFLLLSVAVGSVLVLSSGCGSAPAVATEEESQQSMEATLSFDPMAEAPSDGATADAGP
jgi:hypothetical protein